jgi:hypothetical protein
VFNLHCLDRGVARCTARTSQSSSRTRT